MKLVKTASGKTKVKLSKAEWQAIGKKAEWIKIAQFQFSPEDVSVIDKFIADLTEFTETVYYQVQSEKGINGYFFKNKFETVAKKEFMEFLDEEISLSLNSKFPGFHMAAFDREFWRFVATPAVKEAGETLAYRFSGWGPKSIQMRVKKVLEQADSHQINLSTNPEKKYNELQRHFEKRIQEQTMQDAIPKNTIKGDKNENN